MKNRVGYNSFYNLYVKRLIDVVLGLFLVILSSPCLIIISLLIIVSDGFPVFYRAERGGYQGKNFKILKFRSMVKNADKIGGGTTAQNDPRITPVGSRLSTKEQKNLQRNGNTAFCGVFFLPIFRFCPYYGYQHA